MSFKAGEALIDKKVGDVAGMVLPAQGVDIAKPIAGIATGFVQKDVVGAEGAYQVKYVRESVVSAHKDPRPWMNTGGSHLDFRLHANLSIRMIVEWAFLRHLKEASGLTGATEEEREALKSKWWEEFKDGFTDGMFTGTADAVVEVVPEIFDLPIAEACRKSPVLGRVIGGAEFLKKMVEDETYSFEDATFKTIRLNFADDGRYTGFSLSEDYDTEAKIEGKVLPFLKLGVSLESNTSVTDWEVKTYMSPNSMMKAAADYNDAGNPEGFANYVLRNKKSVLRLVRSGAENPADRPDDRHWQADCQKTNGAINKCLASLAAVCAREGVAGEQARAMRDGFMELVRQMREQRNLTEAQELDLAQRFYTAAAKIYTLDAMSATPQER